MLAENTTEKGVDIQMLAENTTEKGVDIQILGENKTITQKKYYHKKIHI